MNIFCPVLQVITVTRGTGIRAYGEETVNRPDPLRTTVVYGPVDSRRFGLSLGINLSGTVKRCSFDCLYCFRGFNRGTSEEHRKRLPDAGRVMREFEDYLKDNPIDGLDDITIAGNGEPTDNPALPEVIRYLSKMKPARFPHVSLSLLTNGMGLIGKINPGAAVLLAALPEMDRVCVKFDTGVPATWKALSRPALEVDFGEWLSAVAAVRNPVIQTMLVKGAVDNTTERELDGLIKGYEVIKPSLIHCMTMNKVPADSKLCVVSKEEMEQCADYVRKRISCPFVLV